MSPALVESCRATSIRWFAPEDAHDRRRLNAWCAGVGLPLESTMPAAFDAQPIMLEDIAFVSWNVHVGNGDIEAFVGDLRSGTLTAGRPVRHFVLMLQEAVRRGEVPPYERGAAGARRISAPATRSMDIIEISQRLGLSIIYVPSMRNGDSSRQPSADRGSAIISTFPLSDARAVELPGERQRRVAIFARLVLPSPALRLLSVGVVHLDALGSSRRLWLFDTPRMRELQVAALSSLVPEEDVILGADLNTWHGMHEPAVRRLAEIFTTPVASDSRRSRVLDYLFFRVTGGWTARYAVAPDDYGSDHRPLVGRVERAQ